MVLAASAGPASSRPAPARIANVRMVRLLKSPPRLRRAALGNREYPLLRTFAGGLWIPPRLATRGARKTPFAARKRASPDNKNDGDGVRIMHPMIIATIRNGPPVGMSRGR